MNRYPIRENEKFGYKYLHIDEIGSLAEFYKNKYSSVVHERILKRIENNSVSRKNNHIDENQWLKEQVYEEVNITLNQFKGKLNRTLLDIGCGMGGFLRHMKQQGWLCSGIEPSFEKWDSSLYEGISVFGGTIEEYLKTGEAKKFSCVTLNNVLEHIANPEGIMNEIRGLLEDQGVIMVRVPNDFNVLQEVANKYVDNKNWWINIPDHINYFNLDSMCRLLEGTGYEIIDKTCDFPMEFFLLMGEDYVDSEIIGKECHNKRKHLEMNLPRELKVALYRKFAELGLGRNIIVYGRKK